MEKEILQHEYTHLEDVKEKIEIELDEGLMVPISALNALRRAAVEGLAPKNERSESDVSVCALERPKQTRDKSRCSRTAVFFDPTAIPDGADEFFERIYIPLEEYAAYGQTGYGVMLPEIVYDSEKKEVEQMLASARAAGRHTLCFKISDRSRLLKKRDLRSVRISDLMRQIT